MSASFYNADKSTHRRIVVVAIISCAIFTMISLVAKPLTSSDHVSLKADKLMRTAGQSATAN